MKINFCFQITLHALLGEDVFKFNCRFSFPQRLGGVQDSDHSIYEMIQKKDEKQTNKKQNKKNKLCDFFFSVFCFCLGSSQLFRLKYIGERIKIIYEYIIKNLKYRKMHTHVDSYA